MEQTTKFVDRKQASGKLSNEDIAEFAGVTLDFILESTGQKDKGTHRGKSKEDGDSEQCA